ncbi:MAG: hypothetical protein ACXAE3_08680, partial [Candidatus Kariarchaeaceae archaeon]
MRYLLVLCLASLILTSGTAVAIELDQSLKTREEITHIEIFVDPELDFALDSIVERNDNKEWASRILSDTYSVNTWSVNATVLTLQQREDLKTYLLSIEDTSENNGHSFNATAFSAGEKERTFSDVTGRSYDADLTLDWIGENLWNGHQYTHSLFLFDFSDLDRGMDHWFTIKPENLDTGRFVNTFFSGSSGLTNGKSVGGWGGRSDLPVHFIDLSAETWWGDFINGAWGEYGWSGNVISQKIQDFESSITRDSWITDYLNTFMVQTYDFRLFDRAPVGRSVKVQSVVFHDWVDYDISIQDSQWMIQDDIINQTFSTAFPWIRFNISTDWLDLRDYPDVRDEMNRNTALGDEGYELEIFPSFLDYVETSIIPRFFDFNGEDVILPSIVFFLNQTRFTYTGIPIAGIGGIGYQLQGLTPDRYYFDNGTEMRGFSDVIVHEIGHSLGLPHPFSNTDSWAGDFSASVMGY